MASALETWACTHRMKTVSYHTALPPGDTEQAAQHYLRMACGTKRFLFFVLFVRSPRSPVETKMKNQVGAAGDIAAANRSSSRVACRKKTGVIEIAQIKLLYFNDYMFCMFFLSEKRVWFLSYIVRIDTFLRPTKIPL